MPLTTIIKEVGTSPVTIFTCPATLEGAAHTIFAYNKTGSSADITLRLFDQSEGTTSDIYTVSVASGSEYTFPKTIDMNAGDQIIAISDVLASFNLTFSVYTDGATPAATGFTPRGAWSSGASYVVNDIVSDGGNSYIAITANSNDQPPSANWMLSAEKGATGADGTGTGDMSASVYDPASKAEQILTISDLLDEDNMSSNSATKASSQQAIVTYVATQIASLVDSSPAALDTLNELAAALGDDPNFSTTMTNALAGKANTSHNHTLSDITDSGSVAKLNVEDQALTGGAIITEKDLGTVTSGGILTPDPGDRPIQKIINGGPFTFIPSSNLGQYCLLITNNASAGAITTSNFTTVSGDDFDTTNANKFHCYVTITSGGSTLYVEALQ